eukprot:gene22699-29854_t
MGPDFGDMNVSGDTTTCSEGLKPSFRKPYVLTKQREAWSAEEHQEFLKAIQLFNRDWKKIEAHIGNKTVVQASRELESIRSHAQKWFQKTLKSGNGESVPPPRPKRKTSDVATAEGAVSTDSKLFSKNASDGTHLQGSASVGEKRERKASGRIKSKNKTKDSSCSSPTDAGVSSRSLQQQPIELLDKEHTQQKKDSKMSLMPDNLEAEQQMPLEPPNLCLVYLYLGSLFDPKFDGCDYGQALQSLQASDRVLSVALMGGLSQRLASSSRIVRDGQDNDPGVAMNMDRAEASAPTEKATRRQANPERRRAKRPVSSADLDSQGQGGNEDLNMGASGSMVLQGGGKSRKLTSQGAKADRGGMISSSLDSGGVDMGSMGKEMEREFALFEAGMSSALPECQGELLQDSTRQWDCAPDVRFSNEMTGNGMTPDMAVSMADLSQMYCTTNIKEEVGVGSGQANDHMERSHSGCTSRSSSGCSSGSSSRCSSEEDGQVDVASRDMNSEDPTKLIIAASQFENSGGSTLEGQMQNLSGDPTVGSGSPPLGCTSQSKARC